LFQRSQIAVNRADVHADALGDLLRRQAVWMLVPGSSRPACHLGIQQTGQRLARANC
jgi:hypothetical protein